MKKGKTSGMSVGILMVALAVLALALVLQIATALVTVFLPWIWGVGLLFLIIGAACWLVEQVSGL